MATLYIRNVPSEIHKALVRRARERGSSITEETIRLLERALVTDRPGQAALLDSIRRNRKSVEGLDIARLIREDRDR